MLSTQPTLKFVDKFSVTGFSTRTQNIDEFNDKTAKLPKLWQQFSTSSLATQGTIFAVYSGYESNAEGLYTVTVGTLSDKKAGNFESVTIQKGNYLVFEGQGPNPHAVIETWKRIWEYFKTDNTCQRSFISDFEEYTSSETVAIYIGIQ